MNRTLSSLTLVSLALSPAALSLASTNGDNLIGVGATARALGGVGAAAPQDTLGAISGNPAGLSFLPSSSTSEGEIDLTFFVPHVSASVGTLSADSASKTYIIPSLAFSGPLGKANSPWTYGIAAYGVAGLGVDYRKSAIDGFLSYPENPNQETLLAAIPASGSSATALSPYPIVAGGRTELQVLEVAPSVAYRVNNDWSVGLALDLDYGQLNLGGPTKSGLGIGVQPGFVYKASEDFSIGASYTSGKVIKYKGVVDFDGDGTADNLTLESPQQVTFGGAFTLAPSRLLIAADAKWVNWGGAKGYKDFDWKDSWVYGAAVQFNAIPKTLVLRAGYTFGGNPVKEHNNFAGLGSPANATNVQGKWVNNYYYETFRVIGFPAVVEQHLSFGASYRIGETATIEAGYTHAFKNSIREQGTNLFGQPVTLSSSLSEDSFELAFKFRY